jgi:hypothetical protein
LTHLHQINSNLASYARLHAAFDAWVVIALQDIDYVYQWRLDAEHRMKDSGKNGMSDSQVADFVRRFMPAYRMYLPTLHGLRNESGGIDIALLDDAAAASAVARDAGAVGRRPLVGPQPRKVVSSAAAAEVAGTGAEAKAEAGGKVVGSPPTSPVLLVGIDRRRLPTFVRLL